MNQKTIIVIAAVLIIAAGALYYYSGNNYGTPNPSATPVTGTPNAQGAYSVSIKNFAFSPAVLNIKIGDTVTWTNNDSTAHDISGSGFKSPIFTNGQNYSYTFTTAGTFDYICGIHPSMKGSIVVK
jgi:amicyanin